MDAVDPLKSLSFLRDKVTYIHMTNVYDNLPTDEIAVRNGKYFVVEARAFLEQSDASRICEKFGVAAGGLHRAVHDLLDAGPRIFPELDQGIRFWQEVWAAMRLEERLLAVDSVPEAMLPPGIRASHLEDFVRGASSDCRFHLSSGAVHGFNETIALLHPLGYLEVQDLFVPRATDYIEGFRGPWKVDGSVVNWVNGALLMQVGRQAGYEVHFAQFRYRNESRTSILYTTHLEK